MTAARCAEPNTLGEDNISTNSAEQQEQLTRQAEERKVYVRRVSSRVYHRVRSTATTPSAFPHLFQCILLVGLNLDPSDKKTKVPYVKTKHPLDVSECIYLVGARQQMAAVFKWCWYSSFILSMFCAMLNKNASNWEELFGSKYHGLFLGCHKKILQIIKLLFSQDLK
jgi:hypothetical protein